MSARCIDALPVWTARRAYPTKRRSCAFGTCWRVHQFAPQVLAFINAGLIQQGGFSRSGRGEYSRDDGTPTWEALEELVGGLETGRGIAFASGLAAIAAVFD